MRRMLLRRTKPGDAMDASRVRTESCNPAVRSCPSRSQKTLSRGGRSCSPQTACGKSVPAKTFHQPIFSRSFRRTTRPPKGCRRAADRRSRILLMNDFTARNASPRSPPVLFTARRLVSIVEFQRIGAGELQSPTQRGQVHVFGPSFPVDSVLVSRRMDQSPDFAVLLRIGASRYAGIIGADRIESVWQPCRPVFTAWAGCRRKNRHVWRG